jgi:hypothetical protein
MEAAHDRAPPPTYVRKEEWKMSAISHPPAEGARAGRPRLAEFLIPEMWASLAIAAMWIAVAVTAVWGSDFMSSSGPGGTSTTIPSGIAVALFASIGSWAVARYGLASRRRGADEERRPS